MLMAVPKVLVNKNIAGSFSNAIGSVNNVDMAPGARLTDAMAFVQPTAMTMDVDKSVEDAINKTMDLAGVNENIQGQARPENAAALMTQIKQASIPNESYKRRLYKYIEDVGRIWEEFYKTKYNMTRKYKDDDDEIVDFVGTDYKDLYINTRTDVGPSSQWSEITSWQGLKDLWAMGVVTDKKQLLKRLPPNMIMDQDGLIEEASVQELNKMLLTAIVGDEAMAEEISLMSPDEQISAVQQLTQQPV
jgi:hypothetical protein